MIYMKKLKSLLIAFATAISGSLMGQELAKCIVIETTDGEKMECFLSANPKLQQNNDVVTLTYTDIIGETDKINTVEFKTLQILKVYFSEAALPSAINGVKASEESRINIEAGMIHFSGYQADEKVRVYSLSGQFILEASVPANGELTLSVSSLPKGVSIIKTNNQSIKITRQ